MAEFFVKSDKIKIFPCANRSNDYINSMLITEEALTHLTSIAWKESYTISYDSATKIFAFVIKGYYIEVNLTDSSYSSGALFANIKLFEEKLWDSDTNAQKTWKLANLKTGSSADYGNKLDDGDTFYGIKFSTDAAISGFKYLQLLDNNGNITNKGPIEFDDIAEADKQTRSGKAKGDKVVVTTSEGNVEADYSEYANQADNGEFTINGDGGTAKLEFKSNATSGPKAQISMPETSKITLNKNSEIQLGENGEINAPSGGKITLGPTGGIELDVSASSSNSPKITTGPSSIITVGANSTINIGPSGTITLGEDNVIKTKLTTESPSSIKRIFEIKNQKGVDISYLAQNGNIYSCGTITGANIMVNESLSVSGTTNLTGQLNANGGINTSGKSITAGAISASTITASGLITASGGIKTSNITGPVSVSGQLNANKLSVSGIATFCNVGPTGTVSIGFTQNNGLEISSDNTKLLTIDNNKNLKLINPIIPASSRIHLSDDAYVHFANSSIDGTKAIISANCWDGGQDHARFQVFQDGAVKITKDNINSSHVKFDSENVTAKVTGTTNTASWADIIKISDTCIIPDTRAGWEASGQYYLLSNKVKSTSAVFAQVYQKPNEFALVSVGITSIEDGKINYYLSTSYPEKINLILFLVFNGIV